MHWPASSSDCWLIWRRRLTGSTIQAPVLPVFSRCSFGLAHEIKHLSGMFEVCVQRFGANKVSLAAGHHRAGRQAIKQRRILHARSGQDDRLRNRARQSVLRRRGRARRPYSRVPESNKEATLPKNHLPVEPCRALAKLRWPWLIICCSGDEAEK